MVAERYAELQKRTKYFLVRPDNPAALIGYMRDLIAVAANSSEFAKCLLKRQ